MNFLAHFHLSANNEGLIVGNFLGDMMRKVEWEKLPEPILKGVLLHQEIDCFTDSHPIVKSHKELLRGSQGHYSGVVLDILYDHFLAKSFQDYSSVALDVFADNIYKVLADKSSLFNKKAMMTFEYMELRNWLVQYKTLEGTQQILRGMHGRSAKKSQMHVALPLINDKLDLMSNEFELFYEDLMKKVVRILK